MRDVALVAAGMTNFDYRINKRAEELVSEALLNALESTKGLVLDDIDTLVTSYFIDARQVAEEWIIQDYLGHRPKAAFRVENGGGSGASALYAACSLIKSGLSETVLVAGWEKMSLYRSRMANELIARGLDIDFDFDVGAIYTACYGMMAVRHMYLYGEREEDFARIAVKNRNNALKNPKGQWKKRITVDDVLESRLIAYPLKVLDCSLISDGAAVLILSSRERAKEITDDPVFVEGLGIATDTMRLGDRVEIENFPACRSASRKAYRMAGVENPVSEIDCAEIYDSFDTVELQSYEDLGFTDKGKGVQFIEETEIGGRLPVNMSGGLEGMGHPIGASPVAEVAEIFWQLRGESCNQVDGAARGLVHSHGGVGTAVFVGIFGR